MKKLILLIALILGFQSFAEAGRMYDPEIARFTTPDPALRDYTPLEQMQLINGGLFSNNPYNYTLNNPVRYVDPDGRLPVLAPAIWGGIKLYAYVKATVITATAVTAVHTGYRAYEEYGDNISLSFGKTGSGHNIRVGTIEMPGGVSVGVDAELPDATSVGEVHLQLKGKGIEKGKGKVKLDSPADLQNKELNIPNKVRKNEKVQEKVEKAFERLEEARRTGHRGHENQ